VDLYLHSNNTSSCRVVVVVVVVVEDISQHMPGETMPSDL
jgi:hypothetical protein